jgi:ribosomal protein S6
MPLYELVLICRMGESSALATCLKRISSGILQEGGVVRNINNIGDRVLVKNLSSKDGITYGVGRFI